MFFFCRFEWYGIKKQLITLCYGIDMKKELLAMVPLVFILVLIGLFFMGGLSAPVFCARVGEMVMPKATANLVASNILWYNDAFRIGIYFHELCALTIVIVFMMLFLWSKLLNRYFSLSLSDICHTCLVLIFLLCVIRSVFLLSLVTNGEQKYFTRIPQEQRLIDNYQVIYKFARQVKQILPQEISVVLVTGYDQVKDMQVRMQLAYFLYPIDIRGIRSEDPDAYLILNKSNAADSVPAGFRIVKQLDERTLIAMRE